MTKGLTKLVYCQFFFTGLASFFVLGATIAILVFTTPEMHRRFETEVVPEGKKTVKDLLDRRIEELANYAGDWREAQEAIATAPNLKVKEVLEGFEYFRHGAEHIVMKWIDSVVADIPSALAWMLAPLVVPGAICWYAVGLSLSGNYTEALQLAYAYLAQELLKSETLILFSQNPINGVIGTLIALKIFCDLQQRLVVSSTPVVAFPYLRVAFLVISLSVVEGYRWLLYTSQCNPSELVEVAPGTDIEFLKNFGKMVSPYDCEIDIFQFQYVFQLGCLLVSMSLASLVRINGLGFLVTAASALAICMGTISDALKDNLSVFLRHIWKGKAPGVPIAEKQPSELTLLIGLVQVILFYQSFKLFQKAVARWMREPLPA